MSLNGDTTRRLERAIVRCAKKEPWWMFFVGITLIGYRLFRNHQVLFAGHCSRVRRSGIAATISLTSVPLTGHPVAQLERKLQRT
jgi:uncharacterized membrane protein YecN with MAPEG domain